ncbi:hypothetical protein HID58_004904 [Brassica napus]|uniref:Uncharacterized protein n=1 Tax=Brassica napus TaxID=3708 RepID=A0ABQ8E7P5_BRANA|nr:hypothetical protein HID58_004904 [Brassica napus]
MRNVCNAMTDGFSRDGLGFELTDKGPAIHYKDVSVHLPPLPAGSQVQSMAMSCLLNREKDWVVGVTLSGSRLSATTCAIWKRSKDELEFMDLKFDDLPASRYGEDSLLWVESDSDSDSDKDDDNEVTTLKHVTKKFMVYREGEQSCKYGKTMICTEDIGDLLQSTIQALSLRKIPRKH